MNTEIKNNNKFFFNPNMAPLPIKTNASPSPKIFILPSGSSIAPLKIPKITDL